MTVLTYKNQNHTNKNESEVIYLEVKIEVWGDFACFSPPYSKVERLTYPFITPSAARGLLSAIYSKPKEFYWQITRIEVLSPIRYLSIKRNEVKAKVNVRAKAKAKSNVNENVSYTPILTEEGHTQRQTAVLQDVRYRISAEIVPQKDYKGSLKQLYEQAFRRIRGGKCYYQPNLGMSEFVAYFEESDGIRQPIPVNLDAGWMVYDIFDLKDSRVQTRTKTNLTLFHAVMNYGIIEIPPYDSRKVVKGAEA